MFISSNLSLYEKQILDLYSINNIYIDSFKKIMLAKNVKGIIYYQNNILISQVFARISYDQGDIIELSTNPNYLKMGFASKLLKELEKIFFLDNINEIYLEVDVKNNSAISCYKKANFIEVGTRRKYYKRSQKRSDALIMKKVITLNNNEYNLK